MDKPTTSITRARAGYWNSQPVHPIDNPGGFDRSEDGLIRGHITNFPAALTAVGDMTQWIGEQADLADAAARAIGSVLQLVWDTGTADTDPGAGKVRGNALPGVATYLFVSNTDVNGGSVAARVATWGDGTSAVKGDLHLTAASDATVALEFQVTGAVVVAAGYLKVPVTYVGAGTLPAAGMAVSVAFDRTGNKGDIGNPGADGLMTAASAAETAAGTITDKAVTPGGLKGWVNGLTELVAGSIDMAADFIPLWDASASAMRKVKATSLGLLSLAGGTMSGNINMGGNSIINDGLVGATKTVNTSGTPHTVTVDFKTGDKAAHTVTANTKLIPQFPAGGGVGYIDLTNPGAYTITYQTGNMFVGSAPTYSSSGLDRVWFIGTDSAYVVVVWKGIA